MYVKCKRPKIIKAILKKLEFYYEVPWFIKKTIAKKMNGWAKIHKLAKEPGQFSNRFMHIQSSDLQNTTAESQLERSAFSVSGAVSFE